MSPPDLPNQQPNRGRGLRRVPAWLRVLGLAVLLVAALLAWEAWQVAREQAAAPVLSVAGDGTVSLNGQPLVIGADGTAPAMLAAIEGGPPVAAMAAKRVHLMFYLRPLLADAQGDWSARAWRYPRTGMLLTICGVESAGVVLYAGVLELGQWGAPPACTLRLRGHDIWLGRGALRQPAGPGDFEVIAKPGEWATSGAGSLWLQEGEAMVVPFFGREDLLPWLRLRWLASSRLSYAIIRTGVVMGQGTELFPHDGRMDRLPVARP